MVNVFPRERAETVTPSIFSPDSDLIMPRSVFTPGDVPLGQLGPPRVRREAHLHSVADVAPLLEPKGAEPLRFCKRQQELGIARSGRVERLPAVGGAAPLFDGLFVG